MTPTPFHVHSSTRANNGSYHEGVIPDQACHYFAERRYQGACPPRNERESPLVAINPRKLMPSSPLKTTVGFAYRPGTFICVCSLWQGLRKRLIQQDHCLGRYGYLCEKTLHTKHEAGRTRNNHLRT